MLVIFFVILFAGYICLSINHTRAFNVKNAIIRIVERNGAGKSSIEEMAEDDNFREEIQAELEEVGYRINGNCNENGEGGWIGFDANGNTTGENNAAFCLRRIQNFNNSLYKPVYYYEVKTFYHLELPIIRILFDLEIKGDTKPMI